MEAWGVYETRGDSVCRISQDALALACNIDRSYMGRIERGEVNITVEKLYRIAGELACDPSSLLPQPSEV